MTALRLIPGGHRPTVTVSASDHENLHVEVAAARAERLTHAVEAQRQLRAAARHLSRGRLAACGTSMLEALRIVEAEAQRATAMESPCACGSDGAGHGPASSDALDVPREAAA